MKNKKGILVSIIFSLFLLSLIEVSISYLLPHSRLDRILAVLERSDSLIWKQRPNLKTEFFGEEIITDNLGLRNKIDIHQKTIKRMVVLGASPSFGWGVAQNKTYAKIIEKRFTGKLEVINAAHIGHSSFQGLQFLKDNIDRLKPDIVSISYVINDVDRFRFFEHSSKPDNMRTPINKFIIKTSNIINNFEVTRFLRYLATSFLSNNNNGDKNKLTPRVPLLEYEKNLNEFIALSKEHGFKLIFIKMPVNLPLRLPMTANPHKVGIKEIQSIKAARDALEYNRSMQKIAYSNLLPMIDVVSIFRNNKERYLYIDKKLDTIHPNAHGHYLIAQAISNQLEHLLPSLP